MAAGVAAGGAGFAGAGSAAHSMFGVLAAPQAANKISIRNDFMCCPLAYSAYRATRKPTSLR